MQYVLFDHVTLYQSSSNDSAFVFCQFAIYRDITKEQIYQRIEIKFGNGIRNAEWMAEADSVCGIRKRGLNADSANGIRK